MWVEPNSRWYKDRAMRMSIAMIGFVLAVVPAAAQPAPTATEIFELRTKCQAMAQEIAKSFERFQAQNAFEFSVAAKGNLSLKSLHCYALISLGYNFNNGKKHSEREGKQADAYQHLIDAQTGESLASAWIQNGKKLGFMKDDDYLRSELNLRNGDGDWHAKTGPQQYDEVMKYIQMRMRTER